MIELDDIRAEDAIASTTNITEEPLFLDEEPPEQSTTAKDAPPTAQKDTVTFTDADLDKLFEDEDDFRIIPSLDEAELTRQANAKYARHALASSMTTDQPKVAESQDDSTQQKGNKGPRVIPKLDEDRHVQRVSSFSLVLIFLLDC